MAGYDKLLCFDTVSAVNALTCAKLLRNFQYR